MGDKRSEYATVLVTGFGPFMEFKKNASYEIADNLPAFILPNYLPGSSIKLINIVVHRPAIRTSYHNVRTEVPAFFEQYPEADLVLHMGQAYPRTFYTIETQSFRDDYNTWIDEDGNLARDLTDLPGGETLWKDVYDAPKSLKTAIQPVNELWQRTQSLLVGKENTADVRLSNDPGNFCCGFIYYAGLVERWRKGETRNVLFLHVRGEMDDEILEEGRTVTLALIRAAVEMMERHQWKNDESVSVGCNCAVL